MRSRWHRDLIELRMQPVNLESIQLVLRSVAFDRAGELSTIWKSDDAVEYVPTTAKRNATAFELHFSGGRDKYGGEFLVAVER